MFKKYFVYLDYGDDVLKIAVPSKNESDARKFVEGNGEIIAIKEVTDEIKISSHKVLTALHDAGIDRTKVDFIVRALYEIGITEND